MSQSAQTIVEQFAASEAGQAFIAERERQALERRKTLAADLAKIRATHARTFPPLKAAEAGAERALIAARAEAEKAEAALRTARGTMYEATAAFDGRTARLESELRQTAPEVIRDFLAELGDLQEKARNPSVIRSRTVLSPRNPVNDQREERTTTNIESIRARLAGIGAARVAAEALSLEALSVAEVTQRIEDLRRSIPLVSDELT